MKTENPFSIARWENDREAWIARQEEKNKQQRKPRRTKA